MIRQSVVRMAASVTMAALWILSNVTTQAAEAGKPWDRSIALGLAVTTGNSDSVILTGALKGEKIWDKDELRMELKGAYGKTEGVVSSEKLDGAAQYKRLFSERLYGALNLSGLHDGTSKLAYRFTVSPGVGYFFIKSDVTRLSGEFGPGYVNEKYNSTDAKDFFTLRVAERFERKFEAGAKVWQQTEWLPKVNDFQRYLLNTEIGGEASLTKAMSLRIVGEHRYDTDPAPGRRNYDIMLTSQVAYKF